MQEINYYHPSRHKVYLGYRQNQRFVKSFETGEATRDARRAFFYFRINALPSEKYYLVKNYNSDEAYTLYAGIKKTEDGFDFNRPVGSAKVWNDPDDNNKTYLKVFIPVFGLRLYIDITDHECPENIIFGEDEHNVIDLCFQKSA